MTMFPPRKAVPKPKQKCKIVTRKVGDKVEKSIEGECTPAQLKALANLNSEED